jgi:hypothetical protein
MAGEEEHMRRLILVAVLTLLSVPAPAQQGDPVPALASVLKTHVPAQWDVRVRWRDGQLLASITPWPYQAAFDLWYDQTKLHETLTGLCPKPDDGVWSLIKADQDIVIEPTVGGKTGPEAKVSCRGTKSKPS